MGISKESCTKEYSEFISFTEKHAILKGCNSLQELAEMLFPTTIQESFFPLLLNSCYMHWFYQYQPLTVKGVSV